MAQGLGTSFTPPAIMQVRRLGLSEPLVGITLAAIGLGTLLRFLLGNGLPLWLDETFTGAIASEESFGRVIHQTLLEANGPLYPLVMYLWSQPFGISNAALRLPSLLFGVAAPLLTLISTGSMSRNVRLIWCVLVALWIPGLWYAQEARCYSLLFFLTIACSVAYMRLLAAPSCRRAIIWASLGSLAILTHYHALLLIALQGIGYLAVHRGQAVKTWAAAFLFLPAFAWIFWQLPRLRQFAEPSATWFSRLSIEDIPEIINFVLGDVGLLGLVLIAALAGVIGCRRRKDACADRAENASVPMAVTVGTAVFGAVIIVAVGILTPSFTTRYFMPFMPGVLLGMAWWIAHIGRHSPAAAPLVLCGVASVALASSFGSPPNKNYNFETASRFLMRFDPERIVFLWDNPVSRVYACSQLEAAGGFFFRRQGRPVAVSPLVLHPGDDPNARLLAAADGSAAILWLYDLDVRATAARTYPPRIEQISRDWRCRDFGGPPFGIVACHRGGR